MLDSTGDPILQTIEAEESAGPIDISTQARDDDSLTPEEIEQLLNAISYGESSEAETRPIVSTCAYHSVWFRCMDASEAAVLDMYDHLRGCLSAHVQPQHLRGS